MASKKNPKSGEDFTDLSVRLEQDTFRLCNETYAATKAPPPAPRLKDLVERADEHIAEYNSLLDQYTGARLEAVKDAGVDVVRLVEFTETLKRLLKKP